jgi:hypothetical protein
MFKFVTVNDTVMRCLAGCLPAMPLRVTMVDDNFIHCGPWKFSRETGAEIDEEIGWGLTDENGDIVTGSYLMEGQTTVSGGDFFEDVLADIKNHGEDQ